MHRGEEFNTDPDLDSSIGQCGCLVGFCRRRGKPHRQLQICQVVTLRVPCTKPASRNSVDVHFAQTWISAVAGLAYRSTTCRRGHSGEAAQCLAFPCRTGETFLPFVCSLPKGELEHLTTSQTTTLRQSVMIMSFYLCISVYFPMCHMVDASKSISFSGSPGASFTFTYLPQGREEKIEKASMI